MTKKERSNRTVYLVEHIWWCTICLLAGYDWVSIHCNDVPRMVQPLSAGCAKDDSIEIIKRSDYGVLKMVENNSVLRVQRKILFFDYVRFLRFLCFLSFLFTQRNRLCALRIFAQRNNFMSVEGRNGRERNRRYCLGRVGLTRHLWGGLDWLDTYVVVTISFYVSSQ